MSKRVSNKKGAHPKAARSRKTWRRRIAKQQRRADRQRKTIVDAIRQTEVLLQQARPKPKVLSRLKNFFRRKV